MNHYLIRAAGRITLGVAAMLASATVAGSQEAACSQPLSTGDTPTIKDCIYIARASIGAAPCGECVCDTNGSGDIRITDALHCLWFVIGGDVTLDCPPCEASTTTTIPSCASCYDVLLGLAEEADLCEDSQVTYDALIACPCDECAEECPRMCEPAAPTGGAETQAAGSCGGCLFESCGQALSDCVED